MNQNYDFSGIQKSTRHSNFLKKFFNARKNGQINATKQISRAELNIPGRFVSPSMALTIEINPDS